jgi:hypothetical protein
MNGLAATREPAIPATSFSMYQLEWAGSGRRTLVSKRLEIARDVT